MSKVFTAQEMRQRADEEERHWHDHVSAAMLRQAADALERKEKREKMYEYGYRDKIGCVPSCHFETEDVARMCAINNPTIVRRPVGEWEEAE